MDARIKQVVMSTRWYVYRLMQFRPSLRRYEAVKIVAQATVYATRELRTSEGYAADMVVHNTVYALLGQARARSDGVMAMALSKCVNEIWKIAHSRVVTMQYYCLVLADVIAIKNKHGKA